MLALLGELLFLSVYGLADIYLLAWGKLFALLVLVEFGPERIVKVDGARRDGRPSKFLAGGRMRPDDREA